MRWILCAVASVAILTSGVGGCAVYRKCGLSGCPGDAELTTAVEARLNAYPELRPPTILHVQTLDRVVYLSGQVNTDPERLLAQSAARQVSGVRKVVNSINVEYQGR